MPKIVATSDFHGELPAIPQCDILLIGGDVTPIDNHARDYQHDWLTNEFSDWLEMQPATHKIGIAGNHDRALSRWKELGYELPWTYLMNEAVEVDGLKIWGSPYSPKFGNWSFMLPDHMLNTQCWDHIPSDVDILLIHGPAYGILDQTMNVLPWEDDDHVGSSTLRQRLTYSPFPNLKLVVSGHIHESYGREQVGDVTFVNVSHTDSQYEPVNPPMEFNL